MRAVVFAYHNMGVLGISKLKEHGFGIPLVFTHEDSARENVWFKSVKDLCRGMAIEHVTPEDPNTPQWVKRVREAGPDIVFSFYYRYMLGSEILSIPPCGAYNLHGSLLPAYRGRAPVNWVIVRGEERTGVTLHEMVEKPDAGAIVAQAEVSVAFDDTPTALFAKMEETASSMLDAILPRMAHGDIPKTPQDLSKGSYFGGRKPEDGKIFWDRSAREVYNLIRGVTRPYPGAFGFLEGKKILFWRAWPERYADLAPGRISTSGGRARIGTAQGVLVPLEIEADGCVYEDDQVMEYLKPYEGEYIQ